MARLTGYQDRLTDIVWLQTAFLGDMVLTLAAVDVARAFFPRVKQHLITTKVGAEALKSQSFASITIFEKRGNHALAAMFKVKKQLATALSVPSQITTSSAVMLQVHRSFRSSLLARICALPTITYQESSLSWLATARVDRVSCLHEATRVALLLQGLGVPRKDLMGLRPHWRLDEAKENARDFAELSDELIYIGVAPGSVWGTKRWPIERYIGLVEKLVGYKENIRPVLLGSEHERAYAAPLIERFKSDERVISLIGKTSLAALPDVYRRLNALVSNDSSPVHYASAFNVPTVAIFGATTPELGFGPLAESSDIAEVHGLACRPCSDHGPMTCPLGHFRCMRDLSVESVFEKLRQVWQG